MDGPKQRALEHRKTNRAPRACHNFAKNLPTGATAHQHAATVAVGVTALILAPPRIILQSQTGRLVSTNARGRTGINARAYAHARAYARVCACACVRMRAHACGRARARACVRAYAHARGRARGWACARVRARARVLARGCACVRVRAMTCMRAGGRARVHALACAAPQAQFVGCPSALCLLTGPSHRAHVRLETLRVESFSHYDFRA